MTILHVQPFLSDAFFDNQKVKAVLDNYITLHSLLKKRAEEFFNNPNDESAKQRFSLSDPELAEKHSEVVNSLSCEFSAQETEWLLKHPEVQSRQKQMWHWLCIAETALECHYSRILDGKNLHSFFNFGSYEALVENELKQLGYPKKRPVLRDFESIAFVGAGPLPLSAILIHEKTKLPVTCIDSDKEAFELGKKFIEKCGLSKKISYRHVRGDKVDYCIHPLIFIAGLVQDKESVICQIGMSRGGNTIAVRSASGIGALLDRPLSSQMVELLYVYFDRHTPALPPFFNSTWFSSWPFWRLRVDSTVDQVIRPPKPFREETLSLRRDMTGMRNAFNP